VACSYKDNKRRCKTVRIDRSEIEKEVGYRVEGKERD
jgi:hypothetical protein